MESVKEIKEISANHNSTGSVVPKPNLPISIEDQLVKPVVFDFKDIRLSMLSLVGNKGAHLGEMTQMGFPVPPGFTITTEASPLVLKTGYETIQAQVKSALARLEQTTEKGFGYAKNPLLVSVRSGAVVSMPGIMDTVLNIGLNKEIVEKRNEEFYDDCFNRLVSSFAKNVYGIRDFDNMFRPDSKKTKREMAFSGIDFIDHYLGLKFPESPEEQLEKAVTAVFKSWNSSRVQEYRKVEGITSDAGTAVNVQSMVFGNRDNNSLTATFFTRNPSTGEKGLFGSFIKAEQGEALVSGGNSLSLDNLDNKMYRIFEELGSSLEIKFGGAIQEVEATVEQGRPYILQTRKGRCTPIASIRMLIDSAREGVITPKQAISSIKVEELKNLQQKAINPNKEYRVLAKGTAVCPGIVTGRLAYSRSFTRRLKEAGYKAIFFTEKLNPEDIAAISESDGIFTSESTDNQVSHAIVIARGKNKPCVTGVSSLKRNGSRIHNGYSYPLEEGDYLTINANGGEIIKGGVELIDVGFGNELEGILELSRPFVDQKMLVIAKNVDELRRAPKTNQVIYVPSLTEEKLERIKLVCQGDKANRKILEEKLRNEYTSALTEARNYANPPVIGLYSQETFRMLSGDERRFQFKKAVLEELAEGQAVPPKSTKPQLVYGAEFTYEHQKVKVIKTCGSCGIKVEDCKSGNTQCLNNAEVSKYFDVGSNTEINFAVKLAELIKNAPKKINTKDAYYMQTNALKYAASKAKAKKVLSTDYNPLNKLVTVQGTVYRVVNNKDLYLETLALAQEAIK
ncbi:Phosphoenolpyruvate synthase [uncultured archaeon]|nr:Phosphoenolpyruvate synthase [uncultured archaeon]